MRSEPSLASVIFAAKSGYQTLVCSFKLKSLSLNFRKLRSSYASYTITKVDKTHLVTDEIDMRSLLFANTYNAIKL